MTLNRLVSSFSKIYARIKEAEFKNLPLKLKAVVMVESFWI